MAELNRDQIPRLDREAAIRAANSLEALFNLNYLIQEDAHRPGEVRRYAKQSEEILQSLAELLKSTVQH